MSAKAKRFRKLWQAYGGYLIGMGFVMLAIGLITCFQAYPAAIEQYYSRGFYPYFSYLPKFLFSWIPFSVGDLLYALVLGYLIFLALRSLTALFRSRFAVATRGLLKLLLSIFTLYLYFQLSWGLNYYRQPLQSQLGLAVDSLAQADFLAVLDKYIERCNTLRPGLSPARFDRDLAKLELEELMRSDKQLGAALSKTMLRAKSPLSSKLVSYFTVTGYFNPLTQEVQVNAQIPIISYPFTVVHELTHQMGIGFEDECNFVAYLKLKDHENPWYRYAASYETLQYLLRTVYYQDPKVYKAYHAKLSDLVLADLKAEREFWQAYSGWINNLTDFVYQGYLQHNNQPEGMARYSMMTRLVVAWELKELKEQSQHNL